MDPNRLFAEAAHSMRRFLSPQKPKPTGADTTATPQVRQSAPEANSGAGRELTAAETVYAVDRTPLCDPIHRYRNQKAYRAALGRDAPRDQVIDTRDFRSEMAAVDLRREQPSSREFVRIVRRELILRNYKRKTVKSYLGALKSFLRWSGRLPHELDREAVKEYLLYLAESKKGISEMKVHSSAIRTMCMSPNQLIRLKCRARWIGWEATCCRFLQKAVA